MLHWPELQQALGFGQRLFILIVAEAASLVAEPSCLHADDFAMHIAPKSAVPSVNALAIPSPLLAWSRHALGPQARGKAGVRAAASPYAFTADPANAMEVLQEENKLLKNTIADAKVSIADLELQLRAAGVAIPAPEPMPDPTPATPEDYWTPTLEVCILHMGCTRACLRLWVGNCHDPQGATWRNLPCATPGEAAAPSCACTLQGRAHITTRRLSMLAERRSCVRAGRR